jgi:hypothetical protein
LSLEPESSASTSSAMTPAVIYDNPKSRGIQLIPFSL